MTESEEKNIMLSLINEIRGLKDVIHTLTTNIAEHNRVSDEHNDILISHFAAIGEIELTELDS